MSKWLGIGQVFLRVYGLRRSQDRNHAKKKPEVKILPSSPNKPGQEKDLLYGKRTLFSYGTQRVIPSEQDSAITAKYRIHFILPALGASHI